MSHSVNARGLSGARQMASYPNHIALGQKKRAARTTPKRTANEGPLGGILLQTDCAWSSLLRVFRRIAAAGGPVRPPSLVSAHQLLGERTLRLPLVAQPLAALQLPHPRAALQPQSAALPPAAPQLQLQPVALLLGAPQLQPQPWRQRPDSRVSHTRNITSSSANSTRSGCRCVSSTRN